MRTSSVDKKKKIEPMALHLIQKSIEPYLETYFDGNNLFVLVSVFEYTIHDNEAGHQTTLSIDLEYTLSLNSNDVVNLDIRTIYHDLKKNTATYLEENRDILHLKDHGDQEFYNTILEELYSDFHLIRRSQSKSGAKLLGELDEKYPSNELTYLFTVLGAGLGKIKERIRKANKEVTLKIVNTL
jgi:hypothetical protein